MNNELNSNWIQQLKQPDTRDQAAEAIFEFYSDQLLSLVRRQLSDKLASRVDPEDILQSVFGSFFCRPFDLQDARGMFALLVEICLNKTRDAARFHQREKRDVRREGVGGGPVEHASNGIRHALEKRRASATPATPSEMVDSDDSLFDEESLRQMASGATAEQAAIVIEMFESLPNDLQQILNWRLDGLTETEIAERIGKTRRTVTRKLALIYDRLKGEGRHPAVVKGDQ